MSAGAAQPARDERERDLQRAWWLRALVVLVAPRAVFAALRDDSAEAAEARQEPISALAGLAGIAGVLATPVARHILNDPATGTAIVPIWAFIGGAVYALAFYWIFGAILWAAARGLGSLGSYRRARHLLGFAAAPLALSLLTLWPVRILVYGTDLFRTGGNDYGRGDAVFGVLTYSFFAWSALLLLVGIRSVHGWTWARALATFALVAAFPVLIVVATTL